MDARSVPPQPADGALGKDIQASLGIQLRRHYQKIVEEGVPDRFADLLNRYEQKVKASPGQGSLPSVETAKSNDNDGKDSSS